MRKLGLLMFLMLLCHTVQSQNIFANPTKTKVGIEKDNISAENMRYIKSNGRATYVSIDMLLNNKIRATSVYISSLSFMDQPADSAKIYLVLDAETVDKRAVIKGGSPVLLRANNDSVYTLYVDRDEKNDIGHITPYHTYYTVFPHILLTDSIVNRIRDNGIKKIRLSVSSETYDITLKKDNISQFIYDSYYLVKEQLKKKKDFKSDF